MPISLSTGGYDACMANKNLIVVHTSGEGERIIHFPQKIDVYEQFSDRWYLNVDQIPLHVSDAKTYVFFYGDKELIQNAGIGL